MLKRSALWGVYLCGLILFLEAALAGFYFYTNGHLIYTRSARAGDVPGALQLPGAVFQPYMGYTLRRGRTGSYLDAGEWIANNFGFQIMAENSDGNRCCDIPYQRRDNDYLVGVFGGSVGAGFGLQAQADGSLAKALQRVERIEGKNVVVLNFGQSGFRQPQQLTALAYFLSIGQKFDLIINIDGFNEVVTSWKNWSDGVEPNYPADSLWGAWGRSIEQRKVPTEESQFHLANYHELAGRDAQGKEDTCVSAFCYYWAKSRVYYHAWQTRSNRLALPETTELSSIFPSKTISPLGADFDIYDNTADVWLQSSRGMATLATLADAEYLHILQPNQWFDEAGPYTPIAGDHIYKWVIDPVNLGYRKLRDRTAALEAADVDLLDGSLLFKGAPERTVYVDDCCHYTAKGYHVIFEAIAAELTGSETR